MDSSDRWPIKTIRKAALDEWRHRYAIPSSSPPFLVGPKSTIQPSCLCTLLDVYRWRTLSSCVEGLACFCNSISLLRDFVRTKKNFSLPGPLLLCIYPYRLILHLFISLKAILTTQVCCVITLPRPFTIWLRNFSIVIILHLVFLFCFVRAHGTIISFIPFFFRLLFIFFYFFVLYSLFHFQIIIVCIFAYLLCYLSKDRTWYLFERFLYHFTVTLYPPIFPGLKIFPVMTQLVKITGCRLCKQFFSFSFPRDFVLWLSFEPTCVASLADRISWRWNSTHAQCQNRKRWLRKFSLGSGFSRRI